MKELFLHELRSNLQSGKFALAAIVMLIAFLISLGTMNQEYHARLENYRNSQSLAGNDLFYNKILFWEFSSGGRNAIDTLTFPMGKVRKPEPMLYIARGMDKRMRQSVEFFSTFPIIDVTVRPGLNSNLLSILFSPPDLLFMMKTLVSLLAMLFSYNLICEEKERGTLKLLLIGGHSRSALFAGKFLGGLVSIWLAFSAPFLVYLLSLNLLTPFSLTGEIPLRILLIYLVSLLHITVFFCLGALISTFTNRSALALIVALFFWLLVVFILPGLASLMAQQFISVESEQKIARMKLEKAQQMEEEYARANPDGDRTSTAGYGQRYDAIRQQISDALQQIQDEHTRKKDLQAELTTALARISPVGSTSYLFTSLSGNGLEDVKLYQRDLQTIRSGWDKETTEMLNDDSGADNDPYIRTWDVSPVAERRLKDLMDYGRTIEFSRLSLSETLASAWLDFVLLAFFSIAALAIAFSRFLVFDPR